ncbi:unnamed protein product [Chondrus crispus]|uniref:Uncharacterized protein n=1 Tax=Chondrus crispus TaxID=2769 RepID=R7QA36_CHOCR|nr:unnamed protein product [Chondrus crispus]CDF34276.1 unnamed protein product [Chondrus crispus]|eukprot:XP_005714095.1 unnamed protein product [Chondrus crispus]
MTVVDRSGTDWTPWPRLAGVPKRLQIVGGVAAIMGAAGVFFEWRRRVGGPLPSTVTKEWQEATAKRSEAMPMESNADPVVLNPITKSIQKK